MTDREQLKDDLYWDIKAFYETDMSEEMLLDLLELAYELGFEDGTTEGPDNDY